MEVTLARQAGYSGTPLIRKLGIATRARLLFINPPPDFSKTLGPLPADTVAAPRRAGSLDLVLLFARRKAELRRAIAPLARRLSPAGMLWVSWPKKSSGVETDLDFSSVQNLGLATGLVDNKICAIDSTWSGLRFVVRVADRPGRTGRASR